MRSVRRQTALSAIVAALGAPLLGWACADRVEVGYDLARNGGGGPGEGKGGSANAGSVNSGGAAGVTSACVRTECRGTIYQCGNCDDDDGDGKTDALDPDCLGPCDDSEASYFAGQNSGCRQDCYFDKNSGAGNDRCVWSHTCDPLSVAPAFPPSRDSACRYEEAGVVQGKSCMELREAESPTCLDRCLPLTPNGCDCFGCCELPARSQHYVWLGSSSADGTPCDSEHVDDPEVCAACTPVSSCFNRCEGCEVCAGESAPGPSCGSTLCDPGIEPCGALAACPPTFYCVTGCCAPAPR